MPALGVLPTFPFGDQVVDHVDQNDGVVEFSATVPAEATDTYVRIIALWHDNQSLGAEFPTIGIRSGQGGLTPLTVTRLGTPSQAVPIIGTGGAQAGSATCVAEDGDIYFIHIADIAEDNGPWQLRIKNNDPEKLGFVAVSSTDPGSDQPAVDGVGRHAEQLLHRGRSRRIDLRTSRTLQLPHGDGAQSGNRHTAIR